LTGAATLDLYAGTGVLTLEALSRGAALGVAVDRNAALVRAIGEAARSIGAAGLETHVDDAIRYLQRESRQFDVVFVDPPYAESPWDAIFAALPARMTEQGLVYAESGRRLQPPAAFDVIRHARAGSVHYHLVALASVAKPR
jgi:16S rRNA (guanine966-N2)-methyltransferase